MKKSISRAAVLVLAVASAACEPAPEADLAIVGASVFHVLESALGAAGLPDTPPSDDDWRWRAGLLKGLSTAQHLGVKIVAGTDTGNLMTFPGYSMHHELELMVEAGMTPTEALVSATRLGAEMLGRAGEFGTITVGKRADLLILGANPVTDIRNTRALQAVMRRGQLVPRDSILGPR